MTADEQAARIVEGFAAYAARRSHPSVRHAYVYASQRRRCRRRMTLDCNAVEGASPFTPEIVARMKRGEDRASDLVRDLGKVGEYLEPPFRVIHTEHNFRLRDHKGRVAISGNIDGRLDFGNGARPVFEIKLWAEYTVKRIERAADLLASPYTESGLDQLLAYLLGAGEPYGFLVLDRAGLPKVIPVVLDEHLGRVEAFLTDAEVVLDHVEAGTLPPYIDDAAECRRCPWYGAVCNPPITTPGAALLSDPELEAALTRREALKAAADEYDEIDEGVKKQLRGVESAIVGPFAISGKWGPSSRVELPPDLKRQYTTTDPRGRFKLEIVRLGGAA